MLAVLKKRWKPKRAAANNVNINNNNGRRSVKSLIIDSNTMQLETGGEKIRVSVSPRQVHPVSEICPAPNICVQGGRIEFIRPNQGTPDHVKEKLEARIAELESLLEEEKKSTLKERRNTARFQGLIEDRESLAKDVEYERGVRQRVECQLEEASLEADHSKKRIAALQETCHRLEESLRSMSVYKEKYSELEAEFFSFNTVIEAQMQQWYSQVMKLESENRALKSQLQGLQKSGGNEEILRIRLEAVEQENARLVAERTKCEKCLDEVAHQVVQALLAQKGLSEEITTLKDKVKELEKQNYTLSSLLLQQLPKQQKRDGNAEVCTRPVSCDDARIKWRDSLLWFPVPRPSSLNLENPRLTSSTDNQTEFHKDEGYSTMSSEVQCEAGGQEEKTESPKRLIRSSSEPGLSGFSDESDWWEQVWVADSRIDFDAPPELEEWAMDDIPGLSWLIDDEVWPSQLVSPGGDSWSSQGTTSEGSKRSSTMSESDCQVGTQFTSDFYRLVKFESTKSLASTSSRSQAESVTQDRDMGHQSIHYASELEQYHSLRRDEGKKEDICESNNDPGTISKSSDISISDDAIRDGARGLLTVPEEEESLTSSISTPETVLQDSVPIQRSLEVTLGVSTETENGIEEISDLVLGDKNTMSEGVLAELKRFAGSDEEVSPHTEAEDSGCPTGWVHLERASDFNDPKIRANLMDGMMSRSSSSCSSESGDDHSGYQHLHRLHRSRRHKKASATREGAVRCQSNSRASIIGREDLFIRYGAKEQEAVASFDFLEELTSASSRESTMNPR